MTPSSNSTPNPYALENQPEGDFHVVIFAQLLTKLEAHLPISDAYEEAHPQKRGRWWKSQRGHMSNWFSSQNSNGAGAYSRNAANQSAKRCYNRLLSDAGLLWMNEAMDIDPAKVQAAADAAANEPDHRKRCGIIRKHLPWEPLVALAKEKTHLL